MTVIATRLATETRVKAFIVAVEDEVKNNASKLLSKCVGCS